MSWERNEIIYNEKGPDFHISAIANYFATRLPTLRPPSLSTRKHRLNPFTGLGMINRKTWLFIGVAFLGWTWDAFDFFSVSLTATDIAKSFDRTVSDITWGITLVLMLRSVGAVIFGLAGDKWGRKWPFIINLVLFIVLELGTGFSQTYEQFLGIRAIYGIAMGGLYGNAAATALDDCPLEARGFISGLLQQGYAFGYLLCVIFNRALVRTDDADSWRRLFWFGSGPPVLIILYRFCLPETDGYLAQRHIEQESLGRAFLQQGKRAVKTYWLMIVYLVLLMAGMNFMSHGSQDLYPTLLTAQLGFSANASTVTNSVANLGALCGGIFFGHMSQFVGRRLTLIICCILGGALIYPWAFVRNGGINASVFFLQFMVQGAWGVIPIHISELSPPRFRAFIVGTTYQLGNLASSASSTIESTIGERFPITGADGKQVYDYAKVMAILMGCVFGYVLLIVFLGPEHLDANLLTNETDEQLAQAAKTHFDEEKAVTGHDEGVPVGPQQG
jgi:MFS transporter, SHS family, lactate transporter